MKKLGLLILETVFFSAVYLIYRHGFVAITGLDLVLFALATLRLARTISFNEIFEPIRSLFTVVKPDDCKAGANVHPKEGKFYAVGAAMSCPICSGQWSALFLYFMWVFVPDLAHVIVYILAFAGASEMLHWAAEMFEWSGRAARCVAGKLSPDKEE